MNLDKSTGERGFVLVYVLSILVALTLLFTALVYVCKVSVEIAHRSLEFQQCYVVSRSVAGEIVKGLATGKTIKQQTIHIAGLQVQIVLASVGSVMNVQVESKSIQTSDTISFAYDTIAHRLNAWQDNGPGISE